MAKSSPEQNRASVIIALVVTGLGIGWLVGMSVSPVISIVITSLSGAAAVVIAVFSGVREKLANPKMSTSAIGRWLKLVTPVPVMWLVIGIVAGTCLGVWARTHNWLGCEPFADLQAELRFC